MDRIIVLAAGASSRFWPLSSTHHKSFYRVGTGKTIIEETIDSLKKHAKNVSEISLVVAPSDLETAKNLFGGNEIIKIYIQEEPNGEGNALLNALSANFSGKFFLTTGDKINAGLILEKLQEFDLSVAVRETKDPKHFGIVELDSKSRIRSVIEKPEGKTTSNIKITSAYLLDSSLIPFLQRFKKEHYSLEAALNEYAKDKHLVGVSVDEIPNTRLKFPWDLLELNQKIQDRTHTHFIHDSASIAKTAVISGDVHIGKGVTISDFVKIVGPVYIDENSFIGDFSLIRQNSFIDREVVVGAHCEVKNSLIFEGATVHRSYIGDSIIDQGARIGAGVVLANKRYDRKEVKSVIKGEKISTNLPALGAIIGSEASLGTNATIMPGIKIGNKATVWPGKVVLEDVPDETTLK